MEHLMDLDVQAERGVERDMPRRTFIKGLAKGGVGFVFGLKALEAAAGDVSEIKGGGARDDESYWRTIRAQFLLAPGLIYLNNGTLGPSPRMVLDANIRFKRELEAHPVHWTPGVTEQEVREKTAALLGVSSKEVAITHNTTEGMNIIAAGLPLEKGDEVLTSNHEHPGGLGCWQYLAARRGIELRQLPLPTPPKSGDEILDLFDRAITKKTKVISLSYVTFTTGLLSPVKELCELAHGKGVWVALDGAHCPGMMKLDLKDVGCDFFAGNGHKWLLGPKATGMLYVRDEVQEMLQPLITNRGGGYTAHNVSKHEAIGTRNTPERLALGTAIDFHNLIGAERVEARCRLLSAYLKERLVKIPGIRLHTSMDPKLSAAGIASISVKEISCNYIKGELYKRHNIEARSVSDNGLNAIRISTHIYNNLEDVEAVLGGIEEIAKEG